ncbi:hypothetical protein AAVH_38733, partial [Aphelenchoides avenae]
VFDALNDQRLEYFPEIENALATLGDNLVNAYELDQERLIDALEADTTPTERPRDWQSVYPQWRAGVPAHRRQRQQSPRRPQQPQQRTHRTADAQTSRPVGRSGSTRRTAEEHRPQATGHWHRAESPRRSGRAPFPRRDIPSITPLRLRALPKLPGAIPDAQRETISTREARRRLLIQVDNRSAEGLEMFRECRDMHKRSRCNGTTVRRQFPSFEDHELERMKLSPEELDLAHRVRDIKFPSLLHLVLLEWAARLPGSLNNRYRFIAQIICRSVTQILFHFEDYLVDHNGTQLPPLAREYVFAAVHKWSFCCKPLQDNFKKLRTVGPVRYLVRAPADATEFIGDAVDFITQNIPTGIDNNRVKRLAKNGPEPERSVINSTVLFVGDTVAAALASCCTMPGAQYAQMYYWNELYAFLDNAYFGHNVQTVIISVGRADLQKYITQSRVPILEKLVKNYLRQLMFNFPHVEFFFLYPPYDHGQRELWREHVAGAYNGSWSVPQRVEDALLDFPESFRDHGNRFRSRAPTEGDEVDAHGNLTRLGLQIIVGELQRLPQGPFAQIFDPQADVAPLRGGPLRDADFFEFVPRHQQDPPIGPGDLTYDETEEPTYLNSFPDVAPTVQEPPTEAEETPSKSPPRQRARIDNARSSATAHSRSRVAPSRPANRNIALDYSDTVVEPPAASSVPAPPPQTNPDAIPAAVVIDITGRQDAAQIIAQIAQMVFEQANAANAPGQFQRIVVNAGTTSFSLDASPTVLAYLLGQGLLQLAVPQRQ